MKKFILLFFIPLLFNIVDAKFFSDSASYSWAESAVDKWSYRGVISGYTDGTFRGNNPMTRAELITVVNKLNNCSDKVTKRPSNDVETTDWYFEAMGLALKEGIIDLDVNGNLRPNDKATREETCEILVKLFNLPLVKNPYDYTSKYSDANLINYNKLTYVATMIKEGYIKGFEDGTIRPKNSITRAQIIALIDNMIDEVFNAERYSNRAINGNLLINTSNVKLDNVKVSGNIFVLDGAKEVPPVMFNVEVGKDIISNVPNVLFTNDRNEYLSLLDKEEDKEKVDVPIARFTYSKTAPTEDQVTVTIKFDKKNIKIINNNGKNKYTFTDNGSFTFVCEDSEGNEFNYTAKVNNIVRERPIITLEVQDNAGSAIVNVLVSNNDSYIDEMTYRYGKYSAKSTIDNGTEIIDNTFTIDKSGTYTVAVLDEAGNYNSTEFTWKASATYEIIVESIGNGTVTPSSFSAKHEDNVTFTITPNAGSHIKDVIVDDTAVGKVNSYQINNIKAGHKICAIFEEHIPGTSATCTANEICTVCNEILTAMTNHPHKSYEANLTEHWKVCDDCGIEVENTRKSHVTTGVCECGINVNSLVSDNYSFEITQEGFLKLNYKRLEEVEKIKFELINIKTNEEILNVEATVPFGNGGMPDPTIGNTFAAGDQYFLWDILNDLDGHVDTFSEGDSFNIKITLNKTGYLDDILDVIYIATKEDADLVNGI